jgi:hypothetical protein
MVVRGKRSSRSTYAGQVREVKKRLAKESDISKSKRCADFVLEIDMSSMATRKT